MDIPKTKLLETDPIEWTPDSLRRGIEEDRRLLREMRRHRNGAEIAQIRELLVKSIREKRRQLLSLASR